MWAPFIWAVCGPNLRNRGLIDNDALSSQWGYQLESEILILNELKEPTLSAKDIIVNAFQRKSTETKAQLKELRRTLRLETDSLELVTKVINIGLMPTLVAFAGIGLFAVRRRRGGR
jgi:hypothetical protein